MKSPKRGTWPLTLNEEKRAKDVENRVLSKISGAKCKGVTGK